MSNTDKTQPAVREAALTYPTRNLHGKRPFLRLKERTHGKKTRLHAKKALVAAPRLTDTDSFDILPIRESARGSAAHQL